MSMSVQEARPKRAAVYERLGPKECLILERTESDLLVACNENGKVIVKKVPIPS